MSKAIIANGMIVIYLKFQNPKFLNSQILSSQASDDRQAVP